MRLWLQGPGSRFRNHDPSSGPTYLGRGNGAVFPLNPTFRSEPVLDEEARELVWSKIVERGESIKAVSAELGIDMRRVAAVVRLKEVEKGWIAQGKPLAKPYAKAVLAMLPKTSFREGSDEMRPHEPINEIHVHGLTMQQLFLPVPETRYFTRHDAAKAFHSGMLSPDKRVPHPELIEMERAIVGGAEGGKKTTPAQAFADFKAAAERSERKVAEREARRSAAEEAATRKVDRGRFEFRFRDVNSELVGKDGKSHRGVGWRYGVPLNDRKKGQVKIPLSVE